MKIQRFVMFSIYTLVPGTRYLVLGTDTYPLTRLLNFLQPLTLRITIIHVIPPIKLLNLLLLSPFQTLNITIHSLHNHIISSIRPQTPPTGDVDSATRALFHTHTQTFLDTISTEAMEAFHDDVGFFHVGEADRTSVEIECFEGEFFC